MAVRATVSGEPAADMDHWEDGKVRQEAKTHKPGDLPLPVPGLMPERGCSDVAGKPFQVAPKA